MRHRQKVPEIPPKAGFPPLVPSPLFWTLFAGGRQAERSRSLAPPWGAGILAMWGSLPTPLSSRVRFLGTFSRFFAFSRVELVITYGNLRFPPSVGREAGKTVKTSVKVTRAEGRQNGRTSGRTTQLRPLTRFRLLSKCLFENPITGKPFLAGRTAKRVKRALNEQSGILRLRGSI